MKFTWIFIVIQILDFLITINSYILIPFKRENNQRFIRTKKSVVVKNKTLLWENGIIPYEFKNVYTGPQRRIILQAMRHWEEYTCIKFVKRNENVHNNYLYFTKLNCGCCSVIGKVESSLSPISIDDKCAEFGTVLHELGHAIGFYHEHIHPDRDNYIRINFDNIEEERKVFFEKFTLKEVDTLEQPYDYSSIMHYHGFSYGNSPKKQTIVPLNLINGKLPEIGQRNKLSSSDIYATNLLYNCSKCGKTFFTPEDIFGPLTKLNNSEKSDCKWTIRAAEGTRISLKIVPFNFNDTLNVIHDYLEITNGFLPISPVYVLYRGNVEASITGNNYLALKYSEIFHTNPRYEFLIKYETICQDKIFIESNDTYYIESPNYPEPYEANKECNWEISVPEAHGVSINFIDFEVGDSEDCTGDYLEVQHGDIRKKERIGIYCGKVDNLTSQWSGKQKVYLIFVSKGINDKKIGFSIAISAKPL